MPLFTNGTLDCYFSENLWNDSRCQCQIFVLLRGTSTILQSLTLNINMMLGSETYDVRLTSRPGN